MNVRVIANAFSNIENPDEQKALALLAHLAPGLQEWRKGGDLRSELHSIESGLPELRKKKQALKSEVDAQRQAIPGAERAISKQWMYVAIGIGVAILGLVLKSYMSAPALGYVVILAGMGMGIWAGWKMHSLRAKLPAIQQRQVDAEKSFAAVSGEESDIDERIKIIHRELEVRLSAFPKVILGRLKYPLLIRSLMGQSVAIDGAGCFKAQTLTTMDFSKVGAGLSALSDEAEKLNATPVLLSATSLQEGDDQLQKLYGEESSLHRLVDDFVDAVGRVQAIELTLPIVPSTQYIQERVSKAQVTLSSTTSDAVNMGVDTPAVSQIVSFLASAETAKIAGGDILTQLKRTYEILSNNCDIYAKARLDSVNILHARLSSVLDRASWCSKRFYCPRLIQSPTYLFDFLGIEPDSAHELNFDELLAALERDPVIQKRMGSSDGLVDKLRASHDAVSEFDPGASFLSGMDDRSSPQASSRHRRDQYEESIAGFRRVLNEVISGSPAPVLTFSDESRLFYDPTADEWKSKVAPYSYRTAAVQQYGQVLKVHTDVLFPMWEHLWAEKADFTKAELFRTNESLIRMSEKESEKLIDIGAQFKGDMRVVREHLNLLESDIAAKSDEIKAFRDGMESLGLLSPRQKELLKDENLQKFMLQDKSVVRKASERELLLGMQPKLHAERRGAVTDPVNLSYKPALLISYDSGSSKSRLISEHK